MVDGVVGAVVGAVVVVAPAVVTVVAARVSEVVAARVDDGSDCVDPDDSSDDPGDDTGDDVADDTVGDEPSVEPISAGAPSLDSGSEPQAATAIAAARTAAAVRVVVPFRSPGRQNLGTLVTMAANVLGTELQPCSHDPLTGFYRDGCCNTGGDDAGVHTVCALMTEPFLVFSAERGNDLSTPQPAYGFAGLKPGDQWCLCASRWKEALDANMAPPVYLAGTHMATLEYVTLDELKAHAIDGAIEIDGPDGDDTGPEAGDDADGAIGGAAGDDTESEGGGPAADR